MTPEDIRIAIMTYLSGSWATSTSIKIKYPNVDFVAPKNDTWMAVDILMGDSFVKEMGTRGIGLRTGSVMFSIFTPPNAGAKEGNQFADVVEGMFARADVGGVVFDEPNTNYLGVDDSNYFHTVVSIPFNCWIGEDR